MNRADASIPEARCGPGGWLVVVPFKGGREAKSRLGTGGLGLTPGMRRALARALAADTVSVAAASEQVAAVVLVSSDPHVPAGGKTRVVPDPGLGLNAAVEQGIAFARTLDVRAPVAVLTSDLPALTVEDLDAALSLARGQEFGVVPDWAGSGTTLLTAIGGRTFRPSFGAHSFLRHAMAGHSLLAVPEHSTVRADVDTAEDLARAVQLGVGPRTLATLAAALPAAETGRGQSSLMPETASGPAAAPHASERLRGTTCRAS